MNQDEQFDQALDAACDQTPDGKPTLRCEEAFALAARLDVPVETLGRRCNERGIKIVHCQLGCFA